MQAKHYLVQIYQRKVPEEFYWNEGQTLDFLGIKLSGLVEAQQVLDEVAHKGQATRIIEFSADTEMRVVIRSVIAN